MFLLRLSTGHGLAAAYLNKLSSLKDRRKTIKLVNNRAGLARCATADLFAFVIVTCIVVDYGARIARDTSSRSVLGRTEKIARS